jgi:molecular chaperone Hsp33
VKLLVSDCTAELRIRGMAKYEQDLTQINAERTLLGNGRLCVTLEDMSSGQMYQSLVPLEGETLEAIFEHYLSQSEQLPSFLRLYADKGAVCGLLLEKLPAADTRDPDGWDRVRHLAATLTLDETRDAQPYHLLTRVFPEELMRVFKLYAVEYHCPYDEAKVKDMLRGLGREEVEGILAEKGEVLIRNEICNHEYRFDATAIREIFLNP